MVNREVDIRPVFRLFNDRSRINRMARRTGNQPFSPFAFKIGIEQQLQSASGKALKSMGIFFLLDSMENRPKQGAKRIGALIIGYKKESVANNFFSMGKLSPPEMNLIAAIAVEPHADFTAAALALELRAHFFLLLRIKSQKTEKIIRHPTFGIGRNGVGINKEMKFRNVDDKRLFVLRVPGKDRRVGIK